MPQDFAPEISEYFSCLQEWDASYEEYAKSVGLSYTSLALLSAIYGSESSSLIGSVWRMRRTRPRWAAAWVRIV